MSGRHWEGKRGRRNRIEPHDTFRREAIHQKVGADAQDDHSGQRLVPNHPEDERHCAHKDWGVGETAVDEGERPVRLEQEVDIGGHTRDCADENVAADDHVGERRGQDRVDPDGRRQQAKIFRWDCHGWIEHLMWPISEVGLPATVDPSEPGPC